METKYIFVTGGVVSGLGKGITAASIGRLLKSRGDSRRFPIIWLTEVSKIETDKINKKKLLK